MWMMTMTIGMMTMMIVRMTMMIVMMTMMIVMMTMMRMADNISREEMDSIGEWLVQGFVLTVGLVDLAVTVVTRRGMQRKSFKNLKKN